MRIATFARAALAFAAALCLAPSHAAELPQGTPSVEEMARYQGPDREAKLLAAAKAEGAELSVYHVYPALTKVIAAFSKKYGIQVKAWRSSSETVLQRLVTEARGKRYDVDLVQNNAPENEASCREKLFLPMYSPAQANLIPQAIPANHCWVGFTVDVFIAAYNTQKLREEDLPKTYEDLLDPRWKGALAVEADDSGWFGALAAAMGERKTHELFSKLVAANGLTVRKGHSLLANLVASGDVSLALDAYSWSPEQLKAKSAPIEVHPIPPVLAQFSTVAVASHARHPYAAMLFYDFLLGDGQKVLHDLRFVPTSRAYDSPVLKLPLQFIDPGMALRMQDKWLKDWDSIVINAARH